MTSDEWKARVAPRGGFAGAAAQGDTSHSYSPTKRAAPAKAKGAEEVGTQNKPTSLNRPRPSKESLRNRLGKKE